MKRVIIGHTSAGDRARMGLEGIPELDSPNPYRTGVGVTQRADVRWSEFEIIHPQPHQHLRAPDTPRLTTTFRQ